ncbi:MAG: serine protease [Nannocystaceae bacterium]
MAATHRFIVLIALATALAGCATRNYHLGGIDIEHGAAVRPRSDEALARRTTAAVGIVTTDVGRGMGFLVDPRGFILTNRHVIEDADHIETITFPSQNPPRSYSSVHIEYIDPVRDLALLRIDADGPTPFLPLAAHGSAPMRSYVDDGARVLLVGREDLDDDSQADRGPAASRLRLSVHQGKVNQLDARNDAVGPGPYLGLTAPVKQGQSGGPVVDRFGRVVGVVTWTWKHRDGGFAIPVGDVVQMLHRRPQFESAQAHADQAQARAIDYLNGLGSSQLRTARRLTSPSYARQIRSDTVGLLLDAHSSAMLVEYSARLDELLARADTREGPDLFSAFRTIVQATGSEEFMDASGLSRDLTPPQVATFFFEFGQAYLAARHFGDRDQESATLVALRRLHSLDAARSFALANVVERVESSELSVEKTKVTPGLYAPRAVVTIRMRTAEPGQPRQTRRLALQMRFEWGDWYVAEVQDIDLHRDGLTMRTRAQIQGRARP